MIQVFPTLFPQPNTQIIDAKGTMTTPGMGFFRALFNRTGQGNGIEFSALNGIVGAGASQATATALTNDWNAVSSTSVGGGVILPALTGGQQIMVFNNTGGNLNLFPPVGGTLTLLGVSAGLNNAITMAAADFMICYFFSATDIQVA